MELTKADDKRIFRELPCIKLDENPTDEDVFEHLEKSKMPKRGREITISYGSQRLDKKSSTKKGSSCTGEDSHGLGNSANKNVIVGKCRFNVDCNNLKKAPCLLSLGPCFL